jgi:glycine/D-amino acid oxidase-like deaminating enzyme
MPLIAPHEFTMSANDSSNTTTIILGCGIIGLSTAYFLSESGSTDPKSIHLVDASPELFRCASGLAGGFLAADCTCATILRHAQGWSLYIQITCSNTSPKGSLPL